MDTHDDPKDTLRIDHSRHEQKKRNGPQTESERLDTDIGRRRLCTNRIISNTNLYMREVVRRNRSISSLRSEKKSQDQRISAFPSHFHSQFDFSSLSSSAH